MSFRRVIGKNIMRFLGWKYSVDYDLVSDLAITKAMVEVLDYDAKDGKDLLDFALERAIAITKSKIGYIYHYSEIDKMFTLNSWSKEVMNECRIREKHTVYQLEKTGMWGEVVRQRKPILINDYASPHKLKKGYPEGHAVLHKFLSIPVFDNGEIIMVVGVANKETDYDIDDIKMLNAFMVSVKRIKEKFDLLERVRDSALKDKLTGLYNRNFYEAELERLNNTRQVPLSVVFVDMDNLKHKNDSLGHDVGDLALVELSKILKRTCRDDDILARIGGDEFVLLLPSTKKSDAQKIVNRIRLSTKSSKYRITVSIGLATKVLLGRTLKSIVKIADKKMYKDKQLFKETGKH